MSLFLSTAFSDDLIPKWICLAIAWFMLVTVLSRREYPFWFEVIVMVNFVVVITYFIVKVH